MAGILGVSGSPRRGGNSDTILKAILEGAAAQGAATEAVFLRNIQFSSCIGCERCRQDKICTGLTDGMTVLYPKIEASHGLVLVSPSHNLNVSALTKAFIDRLYCYYDFTDERPRKYSSRLAGQGRLAAVAGVCEQPEQEAMGVTLDMQRIPLEYLGYTVLTPLGAYSIFDAGAVKNDQEIMARARSLGQDLATRLAA
jgi:multimeric flavodoxin WrbA